MRYLLKCLNEELEGKILLQFILIFKDLECSIDKNIVLLFERHKPSPRPKTIILTNVTAVTSGNHFDHDTESASFVRLSNLYIT
jgi:hypothetical protein